MSNAFRLSRLVASLAAAAACAGLAGPAAAQGRYDDRFEPPPRYDDRRPYDDERDRYDERRRYDDRFDERAAYDDEDDPAVSFEELDRYGSWRNHPEYGRVWLPDVDDDWRPYTHGHWVWTEEHGWYWESEEPFGWATFHYGRWFFDEDAGWVWVPGNVWGPAWVAWREGDELMGWAPLPPDAYWYPDRGLVLRSDFYTSSRWAPFWIFASPRYMTSPGLHRHIAPHGRHSYYFARTEPRHHSYRSTNRRFFNAGIAVRTMERYAGRPIPVVRVNAVASLRDARPRGGGERQVVNVYRPQRLERADTERWRSNYTRPLSTPAQRPVTAPRPDAFPDRGPPRGREGAPRPERREAAPPAPAPRIERHEQPPAARTAPPGRGDAPAPAARAAPSGRDAGPAQHWSGRESRRDAARARDAGQPQQRPQGGPPQAPRGDQRPQQGGGQRG